MASVGDNISPLLSIAFQEAANSTGPSNATVAAIISSSIPGDELERFWLQLAKRFEGEDRLAIAKSAIKLLDARDAGYEAIEFCLEDGNLSPEHIEWLGMNMQYVNSPVAVLWCHKQMVSRVRSDAYYNSFLQKHVATVIRDCYEDMTAYLLFPDRGPGRYNIDSFFLVAQHLDDPKPFILRWQDWVRTGYFDLKEDVEENETAWVLYQIFNDAIESRTDKFDGLIKYTLDRVYGLLKSSGISNNRAGLYHLVSMAEAKFLAVDRILPTLMSRVHLDVRRSDEGELFNKVIRALELLSKLNGASVGEERGAVAEEFERVMNEVSLLDKRIFGTHQSWKSYDDDTEIGNETELEN